MSISNEAIEAAARAMYASEWGDGANWELNKEDDKVYWREQATVALTAAAPAIQAAALRDAAEVVQEECYIRSGDCFCGSAEWLRTRADQLEGESE